MNTSSLRNFSKKKKSLNENCAFFRNLAHYIIPPYNLARYHGKQQLLGNLIKYESNAIKSQEACGVSNRLISRPQTKGGPGLCLVDVLGRLPKTLKKYQQEQCSITTKKFKIWYVMFEMSSNALTYAVYRSLWFVYFLPFATRAIIRSGRLGMGIIRRVAAQDILAHTGYVAG